MTNKIYNALQLLGFELIPKEGRYYVFDYEDMKMIWFPNDEDSHFLNISVPIILEKGDLNETFYYKLIDKLNETMMYVKAYTIQDNIWLHYERELLDDEEDLEAIISRMILRLANAFNNFCKLTSECEEEDEESVDNNMDVSPENTDNEDS